eukprot:TRINITY_DN9521_c0_g1_i1.p1 TRINITY_DN9521_c0_g1~~TRINITY_DN9521_c0_g1_i1.p1  ORF type:complete len:349 (+),score=62.18 TRINITY_DN9521_c0_g1_i1:12-1058(+)
MLAAPSKKGDESSVLKAEELVAFGGKARKGLSFADGKTQEILLSVPVEEIMRVKFLPRTTTIAIGFLSGAFRIFDYANETVVHQRKDQKSQINGIAVSPNGQFLATASDDTTVWVYRLPDMEHIKTLTIHSRYVYDADFNCTGNLLVTASWDKTLAVVDTVTWQPLLKIAAKSDCVALLSDRLNPSRFYVGLREGKLLSVNVETGQILNSWDVHRSFILNLDWHPLDSRLLLTASDDHTAVIFNLESGMTISVLSADSSVSAAKFSSDGTLVYGATFNGVFMTWDVDTAGIVAKKEMGGALYTIASQRAQPWADIQPLRELCVRLAATRRISLSALPNHVQDEIHARR